MIFFKLITHYLMKSYFYWKHLHYKKETNFTFRWTSNGSLLFCLWEKKKLFKSYCSCRYRYVPRQNVELLLIKCNQLAIDFSRSFIEHEIISFSDSLTFPSSAAMMRSDNTPYGCTRVIMSLSDQPLSGSPEISTRPSCRDTIRKCIQTIKRNAS